MLEDKALKKMFEDDPKIAAEHPNKSVQILQACLLTNDHIFSSANLNKKPAHVIACRFA